MRGLMIALVWPKYVSNNCECRPRTIAYAHVYVCKSINCERSNSQLIDTRN